MLSLLDYLPNEIYREVMSYLFKVTNEIKRYNNNNEFTNLSINKCSQCNIHITTIKKLTTSYSPSWNWLDHYCYVCNPNDKYLPVWTKKNVCDNTLLCWYCIH